MADKKKKVVKTRFEGDLPSLGTKDVREATAAWQKFKEEIEAAKEAERDFGGGRIVGLFSRMSKGIKQTAKDWKALGRDIEWGDEHRPCRRDPARAHTRRQRGSSRSTSCIG